jgi:hypothetical protein
MVGSLNVADYDMFCKNTKEQSTLHLLKTPSLHFSLKKSVYNFDRVKWDS